MHDDEYKRLWTFILIVFGATFLVAAAIEIGTPDTVEAAVRVVGQRIGLLP
jgi:hypothetical protein